MLQVGPCSPGSQLDVDPMVTWISVPSVISDLERRAHRTGQGCWTSLINFCLIAWVCSLALVCGSHKTDAFNFPISLNLFGYLLFLLIRDVLAFPIHLVSADFDHVGFNQPQLLDALQAPGGKTVNPQSLLSGPMSIDSAQSNFMFPSNCSLTLAIQLPPPPPAIPQISICIS